MLSYARCHAATHSPWTGRPEPANLYTLAFVAPDVTVLVSPALDGGGNALQKDKRQISIKNFYSVRFVPASSVRLDVPLYV